MTCNTCHPHPPLDGNGVFEDLWSQYAPDGLQNFWNKFIGACEAHMQWHEDNGDDPNFPLKMTKDPAPVSPSLNALIRTPFYGGLRHFTMLPNYEIEDPWKLDLEANFNSNRWATGARVKYIFDRNAWGDFSWNVGIVLNRGGGTTMFDTTYLPSTQTFTPSTTTPGGVTEGRDGPIILPDIVTDATMETDTNTTALFGIGWDF